MNPTEIARRGTWADAQALAEALKQQAMGQGQPAKTPPTEETK